MERLWRGGRLSLYFFPGELLEVIKPHRLLFEAVSFFCAGREAIWYPTPSIHRALSSRRRVVIPGFDQSYLVFV